MHSKWLALRSNEHAVWVHGYIIMWTHTELVLCSKITSWYLWHTYDRWKKYHTSKERHEVLWLNWILKLKKPHTLTDRCTPRPYPCSLTHASAVSHQVVACITTVGGCLSESGSIGMSNFPIVWITLSTALYNCRKRNTRPKTHFKGKTWSSVTKLDYTWYSNSRNHSNHFTKCYFCTGTI